MDPINRLNRPNVPAPGAGPVGPADKKAAAGKAFDVGSPAEAPQAESAAGAPSPNYDRIRARISDGLQQALPREQILERVVTDEAHRTLGPSATPKAIRDITDAFKRDPGLSQLFDKLLAKAGGASGGA